MKTILFVLLDQWADWEAAYLSSALRMLGQGRYAVKTVSLTRDPVESIGGFRVFPDYDIHSLPADYEALILVGGLSWRQEAARQVGPLVERCLSERRLLGGICDASGFLGTLGILNDVCHTSNELCDLEAWAGDAYTNRENYVMEPAVRGRNVITANGTASLEFAREVLLALEAAPREKILEWYEFHKRGVYEAPLPKM